MIETKGEVAYGHRDTVEGKRGLLMELQALLDFLVDVVTEKDCDIESVIAS